MQFCPTCDNALAVQIGKSLHAPDTAPASLHTPMMLYCKHCPYKKSFDTSEDNADDVINNAQAQLFDPCMYRSNYSSNHPLYYSTVVNQYTFDDPTLPCLTIACPNAQCVTNTATTGDEKKPESEVLFVRYNDQEMKYLYLCRHCRQCWHTNDTGATEVLFDFA